MLIFVGSLRFFPGFGRSQQSLVGFIIDQESKNQRCGVHIERFVGDIVSLSVAESSEYHEGECRTPVWRQARNTTKIAI